MHTSLLSSRFGWTMRTLRRGPCFEYFRVAKTRNLDCDSETVLFAVELHYCTGLSASEVCPNEVESVFNSVSVDGSVEIPHTGYRKVWGRRGASFFPKAQNRPHGRGLFFFFFLISGHMLFCHRRASRERGNESSALVISVPNVSIHLSQSALLTSH